MRIQLCAEVQILGLMVYIGLYGWQKSEKANELSKQNWRSRVVFDKHKTMEAKTCVQVQC